MLEAVRSLAAGKVLKLSREVGASHAWGPTVLFDPASATGAALTLGEHAW